MSHSRRASVVLPLDEQPLMATMTARRSSMASAEPSALSAAVQESPRYPLL